MLFAMLALVNQFMPNAREEERQNTVVRVYRTIKKRFCLIFITIFQNFTSSETFGGLKTENSPEEYNQTIELFLFYYLIPYTPYTMHRSLTSIAG